MNVYKFGGASVKDAEGVKNLFKIINTQRENLIIVVSAMGKMTDALEVLCISFSSNHRFHLGIEMHYVWLSI